MSMRQLLKDKLADLNDSIQVTLESFEGLLAGHEKKNKIGPNFVDFNETLIRVELFIEQSGPYRELFEVGTLSDYVERVKYVVRRTQTGRDYDDYSVTWMYLRTIQDKMRQYRKRLKVANICLAA